VTDIGQHHVFSVDSWSTNICSIQQMVNKHLFDRYLIDQHLADRHLDNRHLDDGQFNNKHLVNTTFGQQTFD
jgi:hypothetical protein